MGWCEICWEECGVPFGECWYCGDWPCWHHGKCCWLKPAPHTSRVGSSAGGSSSEPNGKRSRTSQADDDDDYEAMGAEGEGGARGAGQRYAGGRSK